MGSTLLQKSRNIYEQQVFNRRMTVVLVGVFLLLFVAVGVSLDYFINIGTLKLIIVFPLFVVTLSAIFRNYQGKYFLQIWNTQKSSTEEKELIDFWLLQIKLFIIVPIVFCIIFILFYISTDFESRQGLFKLINEIVSFLNLQLLYLSPGGTVIAFILGTTLIITSILWGSQSIVWSMQMPDAETQFDNYGMLKNIIAEVSLAAGIPAPEVAIVKDDDPNSFAIGTTNASATIVVTTGLLNKLNREELQGVIAHEVSHIRNNDTLLLTVLTVLFGAILLVTEWTKKAILFGGLPGTRLPGLSLAMKIVFYCIWLLSILFAPFFARLIALAVSRQREFLADASAAELTRNPLALANALEKIEQYAAPTHSFPKSIAHLCVIDPLGRKINNKEGFWANLLATHPPIQKRIIFLRSMAYQHTVNN